MASIENSRFSRDSHQCAFGTKCFDEAIQRAKEKCTGTEEELQKEIGTAVKDVGRMLIQGTLGVSYRHRLKPKSSRGNQSRRNRRKRVAEDKRRVSGYSRWDQYETNVLSKGELLREEKGNVITLTGLKIFPKVEEQGGETSGTLEVHVNGFCYATSSLGPNFCFSFLNADVKQVFFRVGDEKMLPILHFHFHQPINVGTEQRRNIQFRLVQNVVGQERSYNDSDKTNRDLKNFIHSIREKWRSIPALHCCSFFQAEVRKADEFQGSLPSKSPTVFGMTLYALVWLVDEPFIVVDLKGHTDC
ncbi:hypothetical protein MKW94_011616 [Papaver nudicaule]|uniref:FACT complex subunit n=1 Tax=Papaver nudicaule TaxID=74823 RepID=A0AA41VGG6_PAPNU|nr:hypothetical protein [Papaver nudicaule]